VKPEAQARSGGTDPNNIGQAFQAVKMGILERLVIPMLDSMIEVPPRGKRFFINIIRFTLVWGMFSFCGLSPLWAKDPVQVMIEGLQGEELKNVQAALTLPPGLVRGGALDLGLLEIFQRQIPERVERALQPFGYYEAQVSATAEKMEKNEALIRVKVIPGEPIRVEAVNLRVTGPGGENPDLKHLVASFPLKVGDVLNQAKYQKAKEEMRTKALNLGYLGAEYASHVIRLNRGQRKAEIDLILETGPKYMFGKVIWEGPQLYPASFLQRFLDFKPGEPYSYSKVYQTQLNLINSDRFAAVNIRADKEEAKDFRVPVRIQVEPSAPKRLRPGVGYSTDFGAGVSLYYKDLNAFRRGHEFNADLSIQERRQAITTSYSLPGSGHIDNRTILSLGYQRELTKPYDNLLGILGGEQARSFGYGIIGSAYLQFRQENFSESGQEGSSTMLMPGLRFYQRRVDDLVRPHKGFRYNLETRGSGEVLGAETNFLQFLGSGDLLIPLTTKFSLLPHFQFGVTWQKDPLTDLPPSLRFYAGGVNSVRGYTYQSLGPKDSSGNVIGGKNLLVGSLEVDYSVTRNWSMALFYDVGNAFNNFQDLTWPQDAGIGVRYYTPVGPVRVDLARQINVDNPGFQLNVSVGFSL
jgi:translocation and assembly module TamA